MNTAQALLDYASRHNSQPLSARSALKFVLALN